MLKGGKGEGDVTKRVYLCIAFPTITLEQSTRTRGKGEGGVRGMDGMERGGGGMGRGDQ